jgi:hypothetical protein
MSLRVLRVLCLLSVWAATARRDFRSQHFHALCPADSLLTAASDPVEEHVGVMSQLECGIKCLEQPVCSAYQVLGPEEYGLSTCQLFHWTECDAYSCGEATSHKVRSYKATPPNCPPAFVYEASTCSCYYVDTEERGEHGAAYAACRQHGAHLVAINSAHEQSVVEAILTAYADTCVRSLWIGGSRTLSSWMWNLTDSLIPMHYQNWNTGQPNSHDSEFCVVPLRNRSVSSSGSTQVRHFHGA